MVVVLRMAVKVKEGEKRKQLERGMTDFYNQAGYAERVFRYANFGDQGGWYCHSDQSILPPTP
jgi:hypothetical protein